jgi:hypothetical protein
MRRRVGPSMVIMDVSPSGLRTNLDCHMAFPIPPHLPRRGLVQDSVSTKILSNLDGHTYRTLNSQLVSRWIAELDETILQTRVRCLAASLYLRR